MSQDSHMRQISFEVPDDILEPGFMSNSKVLEKYMLGDIADKHKFWQIPLLRHKISENLFNDEYYENFKNNNSEIDYEIMYEKLKTELDNFKLTENLYNDFGIACKNYTNFPNIKLSKSYKLELSNFLLDKNNNDYNKSVIVTIISCMNMLEEVKEIFKNKKKEKKPINSAFGIFVKLSQAIDYKNHNMDSNGSIKMNIVTEVLLYTF